MRTKCLLMVVVLGGFLGGSAIGEKPGGGEGTEEAVIDLFDMDVLADGHYLVEMAQGGETLLVNLEVSEGNLKCVKGEKAGLVGMEGPSKKLANGVFVVQVKNGTYAASQIWAFGSDGNGVVTENPGRGERHRVWRVENGTVLTVEGSD